MSALVALTAGSRSGPTRHGIDATGSGAPERLARHRSYHTLDALRGVAAIAVLLFHAGFVYGIAPPAEGQIAVDLFFVMSGFIIASRYENDLRAGLGVGAFLRIRMTRLYPLCLLGTLLGVIPALIAVNSGHATSLYEGLVRSLPLAVLMLPSPFALPHLQALYPLNYVTWSLGLEILINIAYAATVRIWTIRRLAILVVGAFAGLCVCSVGYGTLDVGFDWSNALAGPARILYGFPVGILIFKLHSTRPLAFRVPWWGLLALVIGLFVFDAGWVDIAWVKPVWELFAVCIVVPFIVAAAIVNQPPAWSHRACAVAGVSSYLLYSVHAPFVGLYLRFEDRLHADVATTSPLKAVIFTLGLIALCSLAHVAYDRPVRRFLSGLGASPRTAHVKN